VFLDVPWCGYKIVATNANEEVIYIIEGVQMGDVDVSDEPGFHMSRGEDVF
jgi:hypothetical protein